MFFEIFEFFSKSNSLHKGKKSFFCFFYFRINRFAKISKKNTFEIFEIFKSNCPTPFTKGEFFKFFFLLFLLQNDSIHKNKQNIFCVRNVEGQKGQNFSKNFFLIFLFRMIQFAKISKKKIWKFWKFLSNCPSHFPPFSPFLGKRVFLTIWGFR